MPPSLNIPLIYFMYAAFAAFNFYRLFFADEIIIDKVFTYNTFYSESIFIRVFLKSGLSS